MNDDITRLSIGSVVHLEGWAACAGILAIIMFIWGLGFVAGYLTR